LFVKSKNHRKSNIYLEYEQIIIYGSPPTELVIVLGFKDSSEDADKE